MTDTIIAERQQKKIVNKLAVFLAVLFFIRIRPYYLWSIEDIMRPLCAMIITLIAIFNFSKEKNNKLIFTLFIFAYVWASFFVDSSPLITVLNFAAFAFIPLIKKSLMLDTYIYFKKIFCITLILSIVNYVISLIGININLGILQYNNGPEVVSFIKQPFYIQYIEKRAALPRFNGIFDEPGVIGTICGLMLICEKMKFNNIYNRILLIGGILSLSFYFFIALFYGMFLFSKLSKKQVKSIVVLSLFVLISYHIPQIYDTIWYRFEWDVDKGSFAGDNRQNQIFMDFWNSIKGTPFIITGVGTKIANEYIGSSASILVVIAKHGLLFVVPIISAFTIMVKREIKGKKNLILFILFLILTLYQRPGFYSTYSLALYTMVIYKFDT